MVQAGAGAGYERFGSLPGYHMLDPEQAQVFDKLKAAIAGLRAVQPKVADVDAIASLKPEEQQDAARVFSRSWTAARNALETARELQRFLEPSSVAVLRSWGDHPRSPYPISIAMKAGSHTFEIEGSEIQVGQAFFRRLPDLPLLQDLGNRPSEPEHVPLP